MKEDKILNKMNVFLCSLTQTVDQERQMRREINITYFGKKKKRETSKGLEKSFCIFQINQILCTFFELSNIIIQEASVN